MNPALVIIPTYNERDNVGPITSAVLAADPRVDILICDDNSPDGTGQLADELASKDKRIRVLHREKKEGLGRAYLAAFRWALKEGYQFIIEMDADFSHDPKYLPKLIDTAASEADVAVGSRYVEGGGTVNWGIGRQIISRGGSMYVRTILGVPLRDTTAGFKCFNRRVLEAINLDEVQSSGYGFQIELSYRALKKGFTIKEVPIVFEDRRVGQSKMSRKIFLEAMQMVWKLKFTNVR